MRKTNLLRETNNPSNGTRNLLRETNNPENGTKNLLRETNNPSNGTRNLLRETNNPSNGTIDIKTSLRVVPGSEADTCSENAYSNQVNIINQCMTLKCIQRSRYFQLRSQVKHRVRDREPSRISLRKVIKSLNCRKLRRKHKNMLRKSVPVSSILHSIATNYKQWSIRCTKRQDSFYSNYFANLSSTAYDIAKKSILLCGDIELNPGPQTNNSTSLGIITNDRSNVLFNYRLLF